MGVMAGAESTESLKFIESPVCAFALFSTTLLAVTGVPPDADLCSA